MPAARTPHAARRWRSLPDRARLAAALLALGLCAPGCGAAADPQPPPPSLQALQQSVFTPSCAACHGGTEPEMMLDLSSAERSCAGLIRIPSCMFKGAVRVTPGEPEHSLLLQKLTGPGPADHPDTSCGGDHHHDTSERMPQNAVPLLPEQLAQVRAWISAGAPCR